MATRQPTSAWLNERVSESNMTYLLLTLVTAFPLLLVQIMWSLIPRPLPRCLATYPTIALQTRVRSTLGTRNLPENTIPLLILGIVFMRHSSLLPPLPVELVPTVTGNVRNRARNRTANPPTTTTRPPGNPKIPVLTGDVDKLVLRTPGETMKCTIVPTTPIKAYGYKHSSPHPPDESPRFPYTTPLYLLAYWK